jgi:hypothetical protein
MNSFHYFVILTLSLVVIITVIMSHNYKSRLRVMSGMILSMSIGTSIGLTAGVLFGSLYQGNLFYSTLYSVLVGTIAGTTCGFLFGILPLLEGSMAGLMGGMMGAMLGEMITQDQSVIMLNLLLALLVSTLFLFPILSVPSNTEEKTNKRNWFFKPFFVFLFFTSYLLLGSQLDKQVLFSKPNSPDQEGHLKHNNELIQKEDPQFEFTISVQPSQFSYAPSKIVLKKGQEISLTLKNEDSIDHDIEIKDILFDENATTSHNDHINKSSDFHLHAPAKKDSKPNLHSP